MIQHFCDQIQGWFCAEAGCLYRWRVQQAPSNRMSRFVEVGSWKGKSAAFMAVEIANSGKPITFYCVDHWKGSNESEHRRDPELKKIYKIFRENLADFPMVVPLRMDSIEAAHLFADGSLDFVFIDGSHEYADVKADIAAWAPKIRHDGILAGDDWTWPTVQRAVAESVPNGLVLGNVWYTAADGAVTPSQIVLHAA